MSEEKNKGIKGQWVRDEAGTRFMNLAAVDPVGKEELYFDIRTENVEGATTLILNEVKAFSESNEEAYDEGVWLEILQEFLNCGRGGTGAFYILEGKRLPYSAATKE